MWALVYPQARVGHAVVSGRAGGFVSDSTPDRYRCTWPGCREVAVTRLDVWDVGSAVGWYPDGFFCRPHASNRAMQLVNYDVRKVPL